MSISSKSVYQVNGKPLSQEALYRAKLKYGVYAKPGLSSIGVDSSASDTAALLASSTDLSIHPYKRELSADAATAALIAKQDSAPQAWKRESFAPEAEYAAISARSFKYTDSVNSVDIEDSQDAASSVLKRSDNSLAREALQDLYDFDEIRFGRATLSNSNYQSTPRKLDYRSGVPTSHGGYDASRSYNIAQITKTASDGATKTMYDRSNPKLDHRSGLPTANSFTTANGNVDISKITENAKNAANRTMTLRLEGPNRSSPQFGIPTAGDYASQESFASVGALASQQFDYAKEEKATLQKNTLVDKKVLAMAMLNADRTLGKIESDISKNNLFSSKEMNIKAIQIAQANLAKRKTVSNKIDLGGGLLLSPDELTKMAESIVKPIMVDIDTKAEAQRKADWAKHNQQEELKKKRIEYKEEQRRLKIEAKQKKEAEKQARKAKLAADKAAEKQAQVELTEQKQKELDDKKKELADQTAEEEAAQQAKLDDRQAKLDAIKEQQDAKLAERNEILATLQGEHDEDLKPHLEELEVETGKLNELVSEREAAEQFSKEQAERAAKAKASYEETVAKLDEVEKQIAEIEEQLATAKTDSEREVAEAEAAKAQAALDLEVKEREEADYLNQRTAVLSEIEQVGGERSKVLEDLQAAKQTKVEEEKQIQSALPEHLRKDVSDEISVESEIDTKPFEESEDEPELDSEEEEENKDKAGDLTFAEKKPSVPKKAWSEIERPADFEPGMDPLLNVSTNEKPPMTAVVSADNSDVLKQARAAPQKAAATTKKAATTAVASPTKKGGFKSRFKSIFGSDSKPKPVAAASKPVVKPVAKPVKKVEPKTEPKATSPVEEAAKPEENELETTFSGFSQGSEVKEGEGDEAAAKPEADDDYVVVAKDATVA